MKTVTAEMAARHFEPLGRCRDVEDFEKLNRIGEGTYGTVYRARDRTTRQLVALKRVLLHNEASEGFPVTAIREIKLLKRLSHPNCVRLLDVAVGRKRSSVFLVFEYCEHDLALLLRRQESSVNPFKESEAKRVMLSVLEALEYLHSQNLLHRDIKLSNVLYDRYGCVKLADFGLAREHSRFSGARTDEEAGGEVLTPKVVTLWYRAPEILFGCESYSSAVDLWACGCIFGELLLQGPLMPGKNDLDQIHQICKLLGRATDQIWPGMSSLPMADKLSFDSSRYRYNNLLKLLPDLSEKGLDLMNRMLTYDPAVRITAKEALSHPYFREKPFPQEACMMPTFPSPHPDMKVSNTHHHDHRISTQNNGNGSRQRENDRFSQTFGAETKRKRL